MTAMAYSKIYTDLKARIIEAKNGQITVTSHETLSPEDVRHIFREGLHEVVRNEYKHNHGMTEEEHEILHQLIEGVLPPEGLTDKERGIA